MVYINTLNEEVIDRLVKGKRRIFFQDYYFYMSLIFVMVCVH